MSELFRDGDNAIKELKEHAIKEKDSTLWKMAATAEIQWVSLKLSLSKVEDGVLLFKQGLMDKEEFKEYMLESIKEMEHLYDFEEE